ncbi:hypothetical protein GIB67_002603, partial [Kingdonia uniflora]
ALFRLRGFMGKGGRTTTGDFTRKGSWASTSIKHGSEVVAVQSFICGESDHEAESDLVVAEIEQIHDIEVMFFGIFDAQMGDGVFKYLQSNLFNEGLNKSQVKRRNKATMKNAYLLTRPLKEMAVNKNSATSMMMINGKKIIVAITGDYRAVVSCDSVAHQICQTHRATRKGFWSFNTPSGATHKQFEKPYEDPGPVLGVKKISSSTEFVILASSGIWEVMKSQEAVNLIWHIDDPQEAAECLISCS